MANATVSEQCPLCGQSDRVQTASGANLSAPQEPSDKLVKVFRIAMWYYIGVFAILLLSALMIGTSPYTRPISFFAFILVGAVGAVPVGMSWLLVRYLDRFYKLSFSQWQRAINKWNNLYYCARCAGVFLPGQGRLVQIEQMRSFLYEIEPEPFFLY
jgi:hypothetical protein